MPLSVEVKEGPLVPNPLPGLAVKLSLGPQIEEEVDLCIKVHSLLPPTLQTVTSLMSPVTVHLKVKVSPGQEGRGATNCPQTIPGVKSIQLFPTYIASLQVRICF